MEGLFSVLYLNWSDPVETHCDVPHCFVSFHFQPFGHFASAIMGIRKPEVTIFGGAGGGAWQIPHPPTHTVSVGWILYYVSCAHTKQCSINPMYLLIDLYSSSATLKSCYKNFALGWLCIVIVWLHRGDSSKLFKTFFKVFSSRLLWKQMVISDRRDDHFDACYEFGPYAYALYKEYMMKLQPTFWTSSFKDWVSLLKVPLRSFFTCS